MEMYAFPNSFDLKYSFRMKNRQLENNTNTQNNYFLQIVIIY